MPAVTVNDFGSGHAYYIATRPGVEFLADFYRSRLAEAGVAPLIRDLPAGVQAASRAGADGRYLFCLLYTSSRCLRWRSARFCRWSANLC